MKWFVTRVPHTEKQDNSRALTILRPSFLPYPFHPYHTLTFIPPKIYRPGWKPL